MISPASAEAVGLDIDNSDQCGLSKVKLCSGSVTMEYDDALSDEDNAESVIRISPCRPMLQVVPK